MARKKSMPNAARAAAPTVKEPAANQADVLVSLGQQAQLYQAPDGTVYADVTVNGHRETWAIRGKEFRGWLTRLFYSSVGKVPNPTAVQSAIGMLAATAQFEARVHEVYVRTAGAADKIFIDLGDPLWHAVEITAEGWNVVDSAPVRFRRTAGMEPMPVPEHGGDIRDLRRFLNLRSDYDFILVVGWLLTALRDQGPYPVLVVSGEQGSAKSTLTKILRRLVDPNTTPLRTPPRDERDLFVAASNGHILAFDNISVLPHWMSDAMCRLATGGGLATRRLYTDGEEMLFTACRPVILNGIEDLGARPDLADRAIFLNLKPIDSSARRTNGSLMSDFEALRPKLLGALFDLMSAGLRNLPSTRVDGISRMADFEVWGAACTADLFGPNAFREAYRRNRDAAVEQVVDNDPLASAIWGFMDTHGTWSGTATALLAALNARAPALSPRDRAWAGSAHALGMHIRRVAPALRNAGISIENVRRGHSRERLIYIERVTTSALLRAKEADDDGKPIPF